MSSSRGQAAAICCRGLLPARAAALSSRTTASPIPARSLQSFEGPVFQATEGVLVFSLLQAHSG